MRITCFDSETLANLARQPHRMVMDEIAAISFDFQDVKTFLALDISGFLDIVERFDLATANPKDVADQLCGVSEPNAFTVSTFHSTLRLLEQVTSGRIVDPSTVAWHRKNGVDVETKERPAYTNKETMEAFNLYLKGSNAVFARGTDFDVSLLGSICFDLGVAEGFKYNSVRDIRTACDELLQDFQYCAYVTADRVVKSDLGILHPELVVLAERISKLRKAFGHRALYDAVFDLCLYLALKQAAMKEA